MVKMLAKSIAVEEMIFMAGMKVVLQILEEWQRCNFGDVSKHSSIPIS
jgi:hypothetical protein